MTKLEKLTEDQLKEIRELAKTKPIKTIAGHFKMSVLKFRELRKFQPEIDDIISEITSGKKFKIYTDAEILEIGKMAETMSIEQITNKVGTTMGYFSKSRKRQPELDAAIVRGIKNRHHAFNQKIQHSKRMLKIEEKAIESKNKKSKSKPKDQDSLFTRVSDDLSPEEAIRRFRRLKAEERRKSQMRELKAMD
jgi:hypothetical protein